MMPVKVASFPLQYSMQCDAIDNGHHLSASRGIKINPVHNVMDLEYAGDVVLFAVTKWK